VTQDIQVEFWGTRGSIPSPGQETARFGGNTSCVEVRVAGKTLIFDAGTGIRALGKSLQARGLNDVHLLMSHYHWDHIMGLPFFALMFDPTAQVHLYGEPRGELGVEQVLAGQMREPYFPVPWAALEASITPQDVGPGQTFTIDDVTVRTCRLHHPQHALAYRVEWGGYSVVYATDIEHGSDRDAAFIEFCRDTDILIMDCTFEDHEYPNHIGWGHSTWQAGVRFADAATVGRLVIFHHAPERTDGEVSGIEAKARAMRPGTIAAKEGMVLKVGSADVRLATGS